MSCIRSTASPISFEVPARAQHARSSDLIDQLFNTSEKRPGEDSPVDGGIRQARRSRAIPSQNLAGDLGRDDRHYSLRVSSL